MNFLSRNNPPPQETTQIRHLKLDFEPRALLRIVCAIGIVILLLKLFNLIMIFLLGLMLAITFEPIVQRLGRLKLNRKLSIVLIAFSIIGFAILFCYIILPSIYEQLSELVKDFPAIKSDFLSKIPNDSAFKKSATQALNSSKLPDLSAVASSAFTYLNVGLEAVAQTVLIFIFSIYLLVDGKRAFKWFSDFFSSPVRLKLRKTARETAPIVHHYIRGQVITSAAGALYTFAALSFLQVPAALTLACLAGILDILPVLGFVIAVVPALLLALTVSPLTALFVLLAYILYHAIESYLITPWVYGSSLKVSSLVVLASLIIAGSIGGILFAILVLPMVASYPIIEKIWLVKYLGREVIEKHESETVDTPLNEQVVIWENSGPITSRHEGALSGPELRRAFKRKIMIVEDSSDIRAVLQDFLEVEGYEVVAASNGKEALELLSKNLNTGLIILDGSMPVMSGVAFLGHLRKEDAFKKLPVIFFTGDENFKAPDTISGVLVKPARLETVLEMVDKFYG